MIKNNKIKSSVFKVLSIGLMIVSLGACVQISHTNKASAACAALPTNRGQATSSVHVSTTNTYKIWSRIMVPDSSNNSYQLQVDNTLCNIVVGDSETIPANTWVWVDYQAGTTANKITTQLTAGDHTVVMAGNEDGVMLDRVLLTTDLNCVPTGIGDNCSPPDTTPPTASITSPASGANVSGTISIAVDASDDAGIKNVEYYNGAQLLGSDTTSPYNYSFDTTSVSNGSLTLTIKAYDNNNNATSQSVTINVDNPVASGVSLWPTTVPAEQADSEDQPVELGTKFRVTTAGKINGLRFYKAAENTGTHIGSLWSSTGTRLAYATFTNESTSGWQTVTLSSPVSVQANTTYIVSYHSTGGRYIATRNYFANSSFTNGPLVALQEGEDGSNGVFNYGPAGSFPDGTYASSNYWADVIFSPDQTQPSRGSSDLNNDGLINVFDLSILLSRWNTNDATADINKDGKVNVFDLSCLLSSWSDSPPPPPVTTGKNNIISIGKPAFASSGTASNANDTNYETAWEPSGSGWVALDLSSVPTANRQSVALAWHTSPDDGFSVNGYDISCPAWSGRPYLGNYTIQVNAASGGGSAPTTGWQTVATVTNNVDLSRQHVVNFAGYNWIRVNGSGPNGVGINVDVADVSGGVTDGWLFMGDSITAGYSGHFTSNDNLGVERRSITEMISAGTSGEYLPLQQNAAMACSHASQAVGVIDGVLDKFPGVKYVTLNFGTNDGWGGDGDPDAFYASMQSLVNKVKAKGKIAVVPTIPWPNNAGSWQTGIEAFNAKIRLLYQNNPDVVRGPDLYSLTIGKPSIYNDAGDVHFNEKGSALARKAWADAMLTNVYGR